MSAPVRVLHVLARDAWGGTEMQTAALAVNMPVARSHQSVIFLDRRGPVSEWVRQGGRPVANVPGRLPVLRLARAIKQIAPEVIEAYGVYAGLLVRLAAPLAGDPPVAIGVRGRFFTDARPGDRKWRLALLMERALAFRARCYVTNSRATAERLANLGFPAAKIVTIPNGIDLSRFGPPRPARGRPLRIVCVARLVPTKRHDVLIDALGALATAGHDFSCRLAGDGPLAGEIAAAAESRGIADRVSLLGSVPREDLPALLADADVFVLCSRSEGLPGSVIEAMAASLPVVGSDVNGISEVVDPGRTGLLFPEGDARALAEGLASLSADPQRARRLGQAGRRRAEDRYSIERLVSDRARLYERLAGRAP